MITEPKLLSECGECLVLDEQDHYEIRIAKGDYIVVIAGTIIGKAASNFKHPNLYARVKTIHEFRHERRNGSKFWTSKAGYDLYFVIPKTAIKLLPKKGYSYIQAEINGVKVSFNVTGCGGDGWTEFLDERAFIACNHPVKDLKKIAEVALKAVQPLPPGVNCVLKQLQPSRLDEWNLLASKADHKLVDEIVKAVEANKRPTIVLVDGCSYQGVTEGSAVKVYRRLKKIPLERDSNGNIMRWRLEEAGAPKGIVIEMMGMRGLEAHAKMRYIDWDKTADRNGWIMAL